MSPSASPASTVGAQRPHTLREYALLADGQRGILVGPQGDFAWMCFPRWDSDGVFSSLIGGAGAYAITPQARFVGGGYYEPGSLIWHSRWITDGTTIECREALALPSAAGRAVILRRVTGLEGTARVDVVLRPRAAFGNDPLRRLNKRDDGSWTAETGDTRLHWTGGQRARPVSDGHGGKALALKLELAPGAHHDFVLVFATRDTDPEPPDSDWAWQSVEAHWSDKVPELDNTVSPRDARHSYAVLSGMTSARRGHGRRGDHVVARARSPGPQLRLPLRLDPRPVLHGPGRREG